MTTARKRILFLGEGATMAHFTRPAVLAESLDPNEWEVCFWTPKRFHRFLPSTLSRVGDLPTIDPAVFLDRLAHGEILYTADVIRQYVKDELELFRDLKPDLVVGDYRLSLGISGPVGGVPFASIFNAYWSPYRTQPAIVPELPVTRWISPSLLNPLYAIARPLFYAHHAKPLNEVRTEYGLPKLPADIRNFYTTGDLVFYPDIPELVSLAKTLPPHHHFIGICPWALKAPLPPWWDEMAASPEPKVFVALGSSGPVKALPAVLEALSQMPVKVIVATSGRTVGSISSNVFVADLLPFEETARQSAVIISHGGSSGIYPAFAAGTPVVALPGNIDTHLAAAVLEESGAGMSVRVERATPSRIKEAVQLVLRDSKYHQSAQELAGLIAGHDTRTIFPDLVRRWFAGAVQKNRGPYAAPDS